MRGFFAALRITNKCGGGFFAAVGRTARQKRNAGVLRCAQNDKRLCRAWRRSIGGLAGFEHLFYAAEGLAGAFFVFDEGEADVAVAAFAEADAGADGGFGFEQEFF
jgi:hypothetical protein